MLQEKTLNTWCSSEKRQEITETEAGKFAVLELNNQCMTAVLCSLLTIERELFAIADILTEQVSES